MRSAWVDEVRRLGLSVLMNEHVVLEHEGAAVVVAGVTDYGAHHFDPAHRSDPEAAIAGAPSDAAVKVLLAHQPRSAFAAAPAGFDLQLSGHTHGGQIFPWMFLVRLQQPFTAGLHRLGDAVGLHQPRHRLLGTAEAARRAVGDHLPPAGAGVAVFAYLQSRIRGTASTGPGAPPPGLHRLLLALRRARPRAGTRRCSSPAWRWR